MKKRILRFLCAILALLMLPCLSSCGNDDSDATKLSFKSSSTYDYLKTLDGTKVTINGYIATSSPANGSFMFLMNLPYQSCPFCVPNTTQLSNTIEVFPKKNQSFPYTSQAIKVVGTLVVAPSEDQFFTDDYGYKFNFKIVDATYKVLKASDMSADIALWQKIASSDVISDIYAMYDYVNFLCAWSGYYVENHVNEYGQYVNGYYLHPSDAYYCTTIDGEQWNYGYKDGYFDSIKNKILSVDKNAFSTLVENVSKAQSLAQKAFNDLEYAFNAVERNDDTDPTNDVEPNYTREYKYLPEFERYDYVYSQNNLEQLTNELNEIYSEFSNWLGSWEM